MVLESAAVLFVSDLLASQEKTFNILSYLTNQLRLLDYHVQKVALLCENVNTVAVELKSVSEYFDIVIVLGNLENGVILKALAKITSQDIEYNKILLGMKNDRQDLKDGLPNSANGDTKFLPLIHLQRIFVIEQDSIEALFTNVLRKHLEQYRKEAIYIKVFKLQVNGNRSKVLEEIGKLNIVVETEKTDENWFLCVSSLSFSAVVECENILREKLGSNISQSFVRNIMENLIYSSSETHIQQALEDIEKCFSLFGLENVLLSFNGGKDCTVLLHLILVVLRKKYPEYTNRLYCLYVRSENAFKEQDDFIEQCQVYYNLEVMTVSSEIKEALSTTLEKKPNLKACFMGTRRTDPFCEKMEVFQMTDSDWPQVMRVSPLLDWHYPDIWDYLLYYKVPYCKLYDLGYTSLGNVLNTAKNSSLCTTDTDGKQIYLPAYKMLNEAKERNGRNISKY